MVVAPECLTEHYVGGFKIFGIQFGGIRIVKRDIICTLKTKEGREIFNRYAKSLND